jgi:hypothetical protein
MYLNSSKISDSLNKEVSYYTHNNILIVPLYCKVLVAKRAENIDLNKFSRLNKGNNND